MLNIHLLQLRFFLSARLEEKLSNVESENKVLRQQAVSMTPMTPVTPVTPVTPMTPTKFLSGRSRSILQVLMSPLWIVGDLSTMQSYKS